MRAIQAAILLIFIFIFPFHVIAETQNTQPVIQPSVKARDRASKAMNNLLHGPTGPYHDPSSSQTCRAEAGAPAQAASSGSGKEIAKVISGAWQIATFWCSGTDASQTETTSTKK